jgi:hypothetical protein
MTIVCMLTERQARALANAGALLDNAFAQDLASDVSALRSGVDRLNLALIEAGVECGNIGLALHALEEGAP